MTYSSGEVAVFDSNGTLVGAIGKQGRGPGEFGEISKVRISGDTLMVIDYRNMRYTLLSLDGRFLGSLPLRSYRTDVVRLAEDKYVTESDDHSAPLTLLDAQGRAIAHLSGLPHAVEPFSDELLLEPFTAGFLLAYINSYELYQIDSDGEVVTKHVRSAEWFPRLTGRRLASRRQFATIDAIAADPESMTVTVLTRITDPPQRPARGKADQRAPARSLVDRYTRSVIEVLDLSRSVVVASAIRDTMIDGLIDSNHAYSVRELDSGVVVLDVWRIDVSGLERGKP